MSVDNWNTNGGKRVFARRDDIAPRSSTTKTRVDLGHAWNKQVQPGARTHVVRRDGDQWVLACTGRRATREYPGYAEQANCGPCRKAGAA